MPNLINSSLQNMGPQQSHTLLDYSPGFANEVRAFSTTRFAPLEFHLSAEEEQLMGAYAAFNVTHYCGDHPSRVARCREWLCKELGVDDRHLVLPRQTHTDHVVTLRSDFLTMDDDARTALLHDVDALITDVPGLCIGVSTADCVPILLYAPGRRVVAAIHAGWRGTVKRIVEKAIKQMVCDFGVDASTLKAVIGPSISQEAFEVGEEVVEAFAREGFPVDTLVRRMGAAHKPHIDLWAANYLQLSDAGLSLDCIHVAGICTYTDHQRFFSARRLGINSGRIYSAIML